MAQLVSHLPWLRRSAATVLLSALALGTPAVLVQGHLVRARNSLTARDDQAALAELRSALWLQPTRPDTLFLLARAARRRGELGTAVALLRYAEKCGAEHERVQREQWLVLAQSGQLREAEPHLPALLTDPREDGVEICEAFAQGYFANLRVDDAHALLDVWAKDHPADPQPYVMRGYLLQTLALRVEAVAAYRRAAELAPERPMIRRRLAETLIDMGQSEEAGQLLARCVAEAPDDAEARLAWANCLSTTGQPDRARAVLTQLLDRLPNHFEARRLLGEMELSEGRFREALGHLERALQKRPYDPTTHNALGQALRALGRTDEAAPHFRYVAEAEPALHRLEQQLRQVVQRNRDPQLRYEIGATLLKYGSPEDGAKWLRTVLELQPEHAAAHQALADYYAARGNRQSAQRHRRVGSGK